MDFRQFFNEMIVHELADGPNFIAFRSHLWLYDDLTPEESKKIYKTITKEHPQKKQLKLGIFQDFNKGYDAKEWVSNYIADAFVGTWDKSTKTIWTDEGTIGYSTSPLVKKVVNTLGAKYVRYTTERSVQKINGDFDYWDADLSMPKKSILGKFGNSAYHGTGTKHLPGILNFGLKFGESETNYPNITPHKGKIFLAFEFGEAELHAIHTAHITNSHPVVVLVRIPDLNLIIPDYDADRYASASKIEKTIYSNKPSSSPEKYSSVNSIKTSKHTGIIGYQGRIPSNFIEGVFFRIGSKWKKVRLDTLKRRIKHDRWEWIYHYGMVD